MKYRSFTRKDHACPPRRRCGVLSHSPRPLHPQLNSAHRTRSSRVHFPSVLPGPHKLIPPAHPFNLGPGYAIQSQYPCVLPVSPQVLSTAMFVEDPGGLETFV